MGSKLFYLGLFLFFLYTVVASFPLNIVGLILMGIGVVMMFLDR